MDVGTAVRNIYTGQIGTVDKAPRVIDGENMFYVVGAVEVLIPPRYGKDGICIDAGRTHQQARWELVEEWEKV